MGGMDNGCSSSQRAKAREQFDRGTVIGGLALLNFCYLFVSMHVQGHVVGATVVGDGAEPGFRHSAH